MSNKRIEEMASILMDKCDRELDCSKKADCDMCRAELLVEKGYRKASEFAREIFEEIEKARKKWDTVHNIDHFGYNGSAFGYLEADVDHTIYELKKKYESEKDK